MKYLKIEDNKGAYTLDGEAWKAIDEINKNDLLQLLDLAIRENFEMDEYDPSLILNQAHQIIYKNIHGKLIELVENKDRFRDESQAMYKDAITKYCG